MRPETVSASFLVFGAKEASVSSAPEDQRTAAVAALEANRFEEAYRLLLPLADAGDPEAQGAVGSLLLYGLYRYESLEQFNANAELAIHAAAAVADREQAVRYLEAASAASIGAASFNLASVYVGGGDSAENRAARKARAAELYALAHAQGFTAFGWLMHGDGLGQSYLDILERHASGEQPDPPAWWQA